jgi:hypothetical protein
MHAPDIEQYCGPGPLTSPVVDATPVVGDIKGFIEVFTGCDLLTGEELGNWRWLGLIALSELRNLRSLDELHLATRVLGSAEFSEAYWKKVGAVEVDIANAPPSRFPNLKQINEDTCVPTCAHMAGVSDTIALELEQLATRDGGMSLAKLQEELAKHGWRVNISPEMTSTRAFPEIQKHLQAGRAVIVRTTNVTSKGIPEDHAVLVRSIEQVSGSWRIVVNDPATGKIYQLDQLAWSQATSGQGTLFATLEQ